MSDIRGRLRPRIRTSPEAPTSAVDEAAGLAASCGLLLDSWQRLVLDYALGEVNGKWAAFEVGLVVPRQNGKGPLELSVPILTSDGWTTMGDIRPGQYVYGSDGQPTEVVAVSEVYTDEACFEVTFTDGAKVVAGADHLWHVKDKDGVGWTDLPTGYLAPRVGRVRANGRNEYRYRVRVDAVVDTPPADLPIDPWLLGFWLGDGTHTAPVLTVGHQDLDWVQQRLLASGATPTNVVLKGHENAWSVAFRTADPYSHWGFTGSLRKLGIYGNKRIPEVYLTASVEQRMALLAGLMDSDGSIAVTNRSPQVEFSSSYDGLAGDFLRLARSLGIRVSPRIKKTSRRDSTRFLWTPTFDPFELPRKSARYKPPRTSRHELMSITSIEPVPSVPVRCIQVAAADGVYLFGHLFTPTHNSILEARELAGLFLFGEKLILHTSHEFKTSADHFRRMCGLIQSSPELDSHVGRVAGSHGDEGIELKSVHRGCTLCCGQRLKFIARTGGSGRGFYGDLVVIDEAYNVSQAAMSALIPTLTTSPNPQIWYTSSSVNQEIHPNGQVLARVRQRGIRGEDRLAYLEWSVDEDTYAAHPDKVIRDVNAWAVSNPALGTPRLTVEYITGELGALSVQGFATERLGVGDWPSEDAGEDIIPPEIWGNLVARPSSVDAPLVFAIDYPPNRKTASIASARYLPTGQVFVEVLPRPENAGAGTDWVVRRAIELNDKWSPSTWVVDRLGPASTIIDSLKAAKLPVQITDGTEMAVACGGFYDDALSGLLRHGDQRPLNHALHAATTRKLLDRWAWSRSGVTDISPLVAATLARYGLVKYGKPKVIAPPILESTGPSTAVTDDLAAANF